ncbi:YitT family protein [Ideonella sp. DXS22W]|uniref:YitT family protein n=1 Tax=Pseudaquabacterium inlustre TaxID=2984192 RepID=A0ABU9CLE4_9BURK
MSAAPSEAGGAGEPPRHSLFDDLQALITGTMFVALGLVLFRQAGLMTGGTTGIALLLNQATGWRFGPLLFLINLPFYLLAWRRMGPRFVFKTVAAVTLLAWLSETLPTWLQVAWVAPPFAALGGGLLVGAGFIILFRHRASLGGLNVLVLWLQERYGWRAGHVQAVIDATIVLAALPWLDATRLALSVLAAVAMNFALAINHRPGRYVAF